MQNFYPFSTNGDNSKILMGCFSFEERKQESIAAIEIKNVVDIVKFNAEAINKDFAVKCLHKKTIELPSSTQFIKTQHIFIEEGTILESCIINATEGPIYIGKNCKIMDGAILRGPIFIDENSTVKMGATIYGGTSIGKNCIVGGEIKNSIINNYSNKAHHGYLGDSIVGQWCNLGAGTSNSNVKNTGGDIIIDVDGEKINAKNKFGMLMGDYSRTAINTSINTGTVIGVCCNIFTDGLTPKFLPNFSWGTKGEKYKLNKAFTDIDNWKKMKGFNLTTEEKEYLKQLY
jgi:UDP-N-acetylglucosamine diphosphorylase / glucose-1-phosphate thymidylyltransferase / UDP-N-acetylgalactosamine diphosphorylase / glucosamine-1-phosphate N-acetyltransferase / galactosamine-1-phosphate N-acetyltransferase